MQVRSLIESAQITAILRQALVNFEQEEAARAYPRDAVYGGCYEFAEIAQADLEEAGIPSEIMSTDDLSQEYSDLHYFLKVGDAFFDASQKGLTGVVDPRLLPFIAQQTNWA